MVVHQCEYSDDDAECSKPYFLREGEQVLH